MTLASARVVKIGKTRYLLVRVNGTAKTAKLRITLVGKSHGKVTRQVVTRTVDDEHSGSRPEPEGGAVDQVGARWRSRSGHHSGHRMKPEGPRERALRPSRGKNPERAAPRGQVGSAALATLSRG